MLLTEFKKITIFDMGVQRSLVTKYVSNLKLCMISHFILNILFNALTSMAATDEKKWFI